MKWHGLQALKVIPGVYSFLWAIPEYPTQFKKSALVLKDGTTAMKFSERKHFWRRQIGVWQKSSPISVNVQHVW